MTEQSVGLIAQCRDERRETKAKTDKQLVELKHALEAVQVQAASKVDATMSIDSFATSPAQSAQPQNSPDTVQVIRTIAALPNTPER